MNFKDTIAELIGLGYTQTAIAAECECAKSTINELKTGVTTMPSFDIGYKLAEMHKKAVAADRRKGSKGSKGSIMTTLWRPGRPLNQPPNYGRVTSTPSTPTSCPIAESEARVALKEAQRERARKAGKTAFDHSVKGRE